MKKLGYILALVCALWFASCDEVPTDPTPQNYLLAPYTSKQLEQPKGAFILEVNSNIEWCVGSSAEWLVPHKTEAKGADNIVFNYSANEQTKSRSAIIKLAPKVAGAASSLEIMVTQTGAESGSGDNTGGGNDDGGNTGGNDDGGNTGGGNTGGDDNGGNTGGNTGGSGDNTGGGNNGATKYAGWAELPVEEENSDYYYAYHMRPDNGSQRNFSVCYSEEMGCPVWVACPIHSCYIGSASRSSYSPDPVIPASVQVAPDAGTTNQGNWMNRGHMLASNMRTVSSATNKQVFYYTNIAPQNGNNFNTGGGWWNDMEDIEKSGFMCADTLYTVNGCHWTNKNETFNGQVVPTHFYKVFLRTKKGNTRKSVMECSASELQCVAFYVPHTIGKVTPSRSHMISVSELEEITGHTFFSNVPNAPKDTFNASDWGM